LGGEFSQPGDSFWEINGKLMQIQGNFQFFQNFEITNLKGKKATTDE
jgi:hypothetical protein